MTAERTTDGAPAVITVRVNGEQRSLAAPVALDSLVALVAAVPKPAPSRQSARAEQPLREGPAGPAGPSGPAAPGIAAAVNEAVVPRSRWAATPLRDGDRVEILTAVQGG
ncbi:sulfur carrier protein ThiS [Actinacidiphila yeochonensis]|uniref:sulfur carrier protein ThiS n=1 Tax=Actinacidiphila yeochonensis TaxID=89050 RepID=UPI0007C7606A|nr:sulfur carrier protein ThiS [Actinacidiphila yeochonensis]